MTALLERPALRSVAVTERRETLRELVLSKLDEYGWSLREAARQSGSAVSHETLARIVRGTHSGRLTPEMAEGIARAIRVPRSRVLATAVEPWKWDSKYDVLDEEQRAAVVALAEHYYRETVDRPREEWTQ